ncbi:tyrosine-type recombinase/integrase [Patulibacter sp. S7RM1-6]
MNDELLEQATRTADGLNSGALKIDVAKSGPRWVALWRDSGNVQRYKTVGPAHVTPIKKKTDGKNPFIETEAFFEAEKDNVADLVRHEDRVGRKDRWRLDWAAAKGAVPAGTLTHAKAIEAMRNLKIARELELLEASRSKRHRHRDATFREAADIFIQRREAKGIKRSTILDYKRMLAEPGAATGTGTRKAQGRIMAALGDRKIREIEVEEIRDFLDELHADPNIGVATVNKNRGILFAIFKMAARPGSSFDMTVNPVAGTDRYRASDELHDDRVIYTLEQVAEIARALEAGEHRDGSRPRGTLRKLADLQDAAIVMMAATTGMRKGELLALRWSDVDMEKPAGKSWIRVERNWVEGAFTTPKTKRKRSVPLPELTKQYLARLSTGRGTYLDPSDLVFCGTTGKPLAPGPLTVRYGAARDVVMARNPGMDRWTFHGLRHVAATIMVRNLGIEKAAKHLGHAHVAMTEQYAHLIAEDGDVAALNAAMSLSTAAAVEAIEEEAATVV